ncbi:MAG: hypothetical protein GY807_10955 [Gammaproteobacteria bacterium]|nr:hypothetical protein [Gammaproteobacteria bacterium]
MISPFHFSDRAIRPDDWDLLNRQIGGSHGGENNAASCADDRGHARFNNDDILEVIDGGERGSALVRENQTTRKSNRRKRLVSPAFRWF